LPVVEKNAVTRNALTVLIATGVAATAVVLFIGIVVGGPIGRGLLLFSPWLLASIVQDFWRAILFRDGRAGAAAGNTSLRLVWMAALTPVALATKSDFVVAAAWGGGFVLAGIVGFVQTRLVAASVRPAFRWWRADAWPFGRWLIAQESVFSIASYAIIFFLIAVLGAYAVGGFRAAETVFAPLSLLAPAIALPGLPAIAHAYGRGYGAARQLAVRLTFATILLTLLYFAAMLVVGNTLLVRLYGEKFDPFSDLIVPIGSWQIFTAAALGFTLLLSAAQRGRALLVAGVITSLSQLVLMTGLAWAYGLNGAAWGLAAGTAIGAAATIFFALRPLDSPRGANPQHLGLPG
jgi:O-antigen/teichoic acid export membrane protein